MLARLTASHRTVPAIAALTLAAITQLMAGCDQQGSNNADSSGKSAAEKVKQAANDAAAKSGDALKEVGDAAGTAGTQAQQAVKESADAVKQSATDTADAIAVELKNGLARYESKLAWLKEQSSKFTNDDLNQMITTVQSKMVDLKGRVETALTGDNDAIASLKADGTRLLAEVGDQYNAAVAKLNELIKAQNASLPPSTLPDK